MDKELLKEKIANLKDTRQSLWLALIATVGALAFVFQDLVNFRTKIELAFKLLIFIPGLIIAIALFIFIGGCNKSINNLFDDMEKLK